MKFTVQKNIILDVLSKLQGITGRKTNLAATENIYITTHKDSINLMATDLESGFIGSYPATIEKEGTVLINSRKLYEIIRDYPTPEIQIWQKDENSIHIGNDKVVYHLVIGDVDDFPGMPVIENLQLAQLKTQDLAEMIEKTIIIGGITHDKRAHINGILFKKENPGEYSFLRLVSTDGSRLSLIEKTILKDAENLPDTGFIVPKKGSSEVLKFLEGDETVQVGIKNGKLVVKKEAETILIQLLEGEFPKYSGIINKNEDYKITLDHKLFLMMLKRMSILSSETYKGVHFTFEENKLIATITNPEFGESKEEMAIEYNRMPVSVAFNPKYFIDILNVITDDLVNLYLVDGEKPCLLTSVGETEFISVIMPMRI